MRRFIIVLSILALILSGCGSDKPLNTMKYIKGECGTYQTGEIITDVVYVYTEYTNSSGVPSVPADFMDVIAKQNDTDLEQLFFSRERINDYMQCNKVIMIGETVPVVWIFRRMDNSPVTIEMDTGSGTEEYMIE